MADLIPPMIVTIEARVGQLESQMKAATDSVNKFGTAANSNKTHTAGLSAGFKTLAGSIAGLLALRQVTQFLGESSRAAVEDNKSQALLARQLQATTHATKGQIAATEDAIKAMSLQAGVVDDKIRPAMATLTRATGSLTEATKLTSLAMDVSAGTGRSVESVALALAKAHNGNTGALQRLGISVKGVADPMAYLAKTFEGAAKTAGNTDPYARMNVALDVIKESIGRSILPLLTKFTDWLVAAAPKIEKFFTDLGDPTTAVGKKWSDFIKIVSGLWDWLTKNATAVINLITVFGSLIVTYKLLTGAIEIARAAQIGFNAVMSANPYIIAATAVAALVAGIITLNQVTASSPREMLNKSADEATKQAAYAAQKRIYKDLVDSGMDEAKALSKSIAATNNILAHGIKGGGGTVTLPVGSKNPMDDLLKKFTVPSGAKSTDPFVKYLEDTQKKILNAREDYNKAVKAANDKYGVIIQKSFDEMNSLIEQSMGRLKTAFATAVATDIGDMWKGLAAEGMGSASTLLSNLQSRLTNIKKLAANAAVLAGKGYSQTFIEQVVAQGPDVGNQMAEALKEASPETAKSLQALFRETEVVSATGMDALSRQLFLKSGLATDQMKALYKNAQDAMVSAQNSLASALTSAADTLNTSLGTIEVEFGKKLTSMTGKLGAFSAQIAAVWAALNGGYVTSGTTTKADMSYSAWAASNAAVAATLGIDTTKPQEIQFGKGTSKAIVFNQTNNTNATPDQIATSTVSAIKYGLATT